MKKKYQSRIMEAIHEEAQALLEAGTIDKNRMAEYDNACLKTCKNKPVSVEPVTTTRGTEPAASVYAKSSN